MLDLIVRNVNLSDGREGFDIAIKDGVIVDVVVSLKGKAKREIDATGQQYRNGRIKGRHYRGNVQSSQPGGQGEKHVACGVADADKRDHRHLFDAGPLDFLPR
jgi:N-acyl-D-aspartate/D-glutamate deacylase